MHPGGPATSSEPRSQSAARVAIIDDHDVVHAGVEAWCASADPSISVVGSFFTATEFFSAFPSFPDGVDVVVLDLQLDASKPDFETLRALCARGQRVVVYSYLTADEVVLTCLELGAV